MVPDKNFCLKSTLVFTLNYYIDGIGYFAFFPPDVAPYFLKLVKYKILSPPITFANPRTKVGRARAQACCLPLPPHPAPFPKGPNFIEPAFANVRFEKGAKVQGVIHKVTETDLDRIVAFEGETYELIKAPVTFGNKTVHAKTLRCKDSTTEEFPVSRRCIPPPCVGHRRYTCLLLQLRPHIR